MYGLVKTIPLDLSATKNMVIDEHHQIVDQATKIFVLSKGNFYTKDLLVKNAQTGTPLLFGTDYEVSQIYMAASKEANRPVYAAIRIITDVISSVQVTYRPIGGKFQSFFGVLLEIQQTLDPNFEERITFNQLLNRPTTFKPALHTYAFHEIQNLERMIDGLYDILTELYRSHTPKYAEMYVYLHGTLENTILSINQMIVEARNRIFNFEEAVRYREGDILITDNPQVPSNYLRYGSWIKLQDTLLIGAGELTPAGGNIELQLGTDINNDLVAIKTCFWQLVEDDSVPITLTANKTTVNEKGSILFTITGGPRRANQGIGFTISGVSGSDIQPPDLTGTVFLDNAGIGTYQVSLLQDRLIEGAEILRFSLNDYSFQSIVTVNDSSISPQYEMYFSDDENGIRQINGFTENDTIYLVIRSKNAGSTWTAFLDYAGSNTVPDDFVTILPQLVVVNASLAIIPIQVKQDRLTDGVKRLFVSLRLSQTTGSPIVSATCRISDTSRSPVYQLYYSSDSDGNLQVSQVNEGDTFYLNILATNTPDGSQLALNYAGTYNSADFNQNLVRVVQIINGRASIQYTAVIDNASEGLEILTSQVLLNGSVIKSSDLRVIDTSKNVNASVKVSSNRFGTNDVNVLSEGDRGFIVIETNLIPDGTEMTLIYRGTATNADFVSPLPTSVIINADYAFVPFEIRMDKSTEGPQQLTIALKSNTSGDEIASFKLTIEDLSLTPIYRVFFSSDEAGAIPVSDVDEGATVYVQFRSSDVNAVTTHAIVSRMGTLNTTIANGDVIATTPSRVTFVNGRSWFKVDVRRDQRTEGVETYYVGLLETTSTSSATIASSSIQVNDLSTTPTWTLRLSESSTTIVDVSGSSVLEGGKLYAIFDSTNLNVGDVFWLNYFFNGLSVDEEDFNQSLPEFFQVTGPRTVIEFDIASDGSVEQTERFVVNVYRDAARANKILTKFVDVVNPTFQSKFSASPDGSGSVSVANEGNTVYLVLDGSSVRPNAIWLLSYYMDGQLIIGSSPDITGTLVSSVQFDVSRKIIPIQFSLDGIADGRKRLTVQLRAENQTPDSTPLTNTFIDVNDTSFGGLTVNGTYGPGSIGTLSIGANVTKSLILVAGGGAGDLRSAGADSNTSLEGVDGQSTLLSFGGNSVVTLTGGLKGDQYDAENSGLSGAVFVNNTLLNNLSQFQLSVTNNLGGIKAPGDGVFGGASVVVGGQGEGSTGVVMGTGGGGSGALFFTIANLTSSTLTFGISIGRGGQSMRTNSELVWNNGCLILS